MKSTSIHSLNADTGLNFLEKILYIFLNFVNNLFPYTRVDKRIDFKNFNPQDLDDVWKKTYKESSAARKFSDIFWYSLPWQNIKSELGVINIFDTGCGHGNYGSRIKEGSGGLISKYTGIDAKRRQNWTELEKNNQNFQFIVSRSSNILPLIPKDTNLFITQSAIEHFDEDLQFFELLKNFRNDSGHSVMQIHVFPASSTLPLYLFHGLRQYTPRTISKITRLFDDESEFSLYGLGGKECKKLHFKYFTWPVLIRRKYERATFDKDIYDRELRKAFESDLKNPSRAPIFWALVIKTTRS